MAETERDFIEQAESQCRTEADMYAMICSLQASKAVLVEQLRLANELLSGRAGKLLRKGKQFIVIADDEPYYLAAYDLICAHESRKGTWTDEDDERMTQASENSGKGQHTVANAIWHLGTGSYVKAKDSEATDPPVTFKRRDTE